jgi:putative two-component system response regulator
LFEEFEETPSGPRTVLVVDDTPENLTVIGGLLQPHYRVLVANSGERALRLAQGTPMPDLILLDVMMPGMDGYAVLERLRAEPATQAIPVVFVTAMGADEDERRGLQLGAVDYIAKPIRPAILLARVATQLELKRARDWLSNHNAYLEHEVERRMRENELIKNVSLHALALLAEKRDNETGNHLHRTQSYVTALMRQVADQPRFATALGVEQQRLIAKAAPLHDIGKVGVPDRILLKPGKLTADEFVIMKTHSTIGSDAIAEAIERVLQGDADPSVTATPLAFLEVARQIARHHHERWDGSGYPDGLAGEAIPLAARLMAVADVFDALTCRRHYKPAFPLAQAEAILIEGRGQHFDPDLIDAYLAIREEFAAIAQRFADAEPELGV